MMLILKQNAKKQRIQAFIKNEVTPDLFMKNSLDLVTIIQVKKTEN